jgi:protein disulfide-isomerase A6
MGVQGFPTLKIIKPGNKKGKPVVEDYQGQRTAKAIVDAVRDKIPNHVKKLQDSNIDAWLADTTTATKAILFTEKGTTSALIRALAVDFLGLVGVGQIRSKETASVEKFEVTEFPSVVVIPSDGSERTIYSGEMDKKSLVKLLSKFAEPNPDPPAAKAKPSKSKEPKKAATASSSFSKASKAHKSADLEDELGAKTIVLDDETPTESPLPILDRDQPVAMPEIPAIQVLATASELKEAALAPKKGTSVLVLGPNVNEGVLGEEAAKALIHFAQIADKHNQRRDHTFPFYNVPADNEAAKAVRDDLGLKGEAYLEIVAVNMKRGWWRHFQGDASSQAEIENFIDAIKLGDGTRIKLPATFGGKEPEPEVPEPEPAAEPEPEAAAVEEPEADGSVAEPEPAPVPEPEPEEETDPKHIEL